MERIAQMQAAAKSAKPPITANGCGAEATVSTG